MISSLLLLLCVILPVVNCLCSFNCSNSLSYLCISDTINSPHLEKVLREQIKHRFAVCHFDVDTGISYKVNLDSSATQLSRHDSAVTESVFLEKDCIEPLRYWDNTASWVSFVFVKLYIAFVLLCQCLEHYECI
ncbi:hypothetical protein Y032_0316g2284 [Ancylostoma ceylanicum]|uniref:Uncharacterized protein n=1 Tax=Ancylostoma ceylanicum TaxID=53326 RepID=A0A016S1A7_9BILA|nr:hypothetical protein Y032_0316g2284 [Ancylostoma ceylanicum]